ncbi:MAG TPA: alpha/beta hydrolase [Chloroflexota bacterium]|nr:alpha/beta hydrolase [Chloroflexota bacterium]
MAYVEIPGARLWYTDSGGSGVPIVLMHAASGTTDAWQYQIPAFSAAGYRCIAYDRRGAGRTEIDPSTGDQPGCASEDLAQLADKLGLDRFHLAGTAAGAAPSIDFALSYPERLRSLVIADGTCGVQDPEHLELLERIRPPEFQALPVELREVGACYRGTNPEGLRRWVEIAHASGEGSAPRQTARNHVTYALLETMRLPVLAIVGTADQTTPPVVMRAAAAHIAGCQIEYIPEAGHAAFWEQPDLWNRLVLDFISKH